MYIAHLDHTLLLPLSPILIPLFFPNSILSFFIPSSLGSTEMREYANFVLLRLIIPLVKIFLVIISQNFLSL